MLAALLTTLVRGEAGAFFARLKRVAGLYALIALVALALLAFLFHALFLWLSFHFGEMATTLGFAAAFALILGALLVMLRLSGRRPLPEADDRLRRDIASIAGVTALSKAPQLVRALQRKRGLLIVPTAAAGFWGLYRILSYVRRR